MMKKIILLVALIIPFTVIYAQKSNVTQAETLLNSQKIGEALELINQAIDPSNEKAEKSIPMVKTWEVRGDIFAAIYKSSDENVQKLASNPLDLAIESYKKAIELDGKGGSNSTKLKLTMLLTDISNKAIEEYGSENFDSALKSFETILDIEAMPIMKEVGVDTTMIYNAGLTAQSAGKYETAIKYYNEVLKYDDKKGNIYESISSCYLGLQDSDKALSVLQEGFNKYPENNSIIVAMINLYLTSDRANEAMTYLDVAIEKEPTNPSFYFVKGTLYDTMKDYDNAIDYYKKTISMAPDMHDAYYNMGVIYYNKGVNQLNIANAVPTNEPAKYEEEKNKADVEFLNAIPFLEKATELDAKDVDSLESLRSLYLRLKMTDKYNEVVSKLENL